jgi:hypothetical protein
VIFTSRSTRFDCIEKDIIIRKRKDLEDKEKKTVQFFLRLQNRYEEPGGGGGLWGDTLAALTVSQTGMTTKNMV